MGGKGTRGSIGWFMAAVTAVLALLVSTGCGSSTYVKIDGVETRGDNVPGPSLAAGAGKPQLSFCVLKGSIGNTFRSRNSSVKDDEHYLGHIPDFLKRDAPFESIRPLAGEVEGQGCDVLLSPFIMVYVTPLGRVEATVTVEAFAAGKQGGSLMTALVRDESSVEAAAEKVGRIVYNTFAPGSPLHNRIFAKKETSFEAFKTVAKQYRLMPVKPTLPEEARKYKVQAEAAFNRKDFDQAAARYLDALKIAPWWPEGYFNRALILGELGQYRIAMEEMRKYLILVPAAPDARAVQDKIYEWEGLAGRQGGTGRN